MVTKRIKVRIILNDVGESMIEVFIEPEQYVFLRGIQDIMTERNPSLSQPSMIVEMIED